MADHTSLDAAIEHAFAIVEQHDFDYGVGVQFDDPVTSSILFVQWMRDEDGHLGYLEVGLNVADEPVLATLSQMGFGPHSDEWPNLYSHPDPRPLSGTSNRDVARLITDLARILGSDRAGQFRSYPE